MDGICIILLWFFRCSLLTRRIKRSLHFEGKRGCRCADGILKRRRILRMSANNGIWFLSLKRNRRKRRNRMSFEMRCEKRIWIEWIAQLDIGHFEYRENVLGMQKKWFQFDFSIPYTFFRYVRNTKGVWFKILFPSSISFAFHSIQFVSSHLHSDLFWVHLQWHKGEKRWLTIWLKLK